MYNYLTEDELLHKANIAICTQIVIELIKVELFHSPDSVGLVQFWF